VTGVMTPTESATVGVIHVLLLGFLGTGALRVKDLFPVEMDADAVTGIVTTSSFFGWIMAREKIGPRSLPPSPVCSSKTVQTPHLQGWPVRSEWPADRDH